MTAMAETREPNLDKHLLDLEGVSKRFPGVQALDDVRLSIEAGQVMALVGENGAGKSTLVKILTGIYQPDAGRLRIAGEKVRFASPHDAWRAGITAIHQETVMFEELTVAENIFMGHQPARRPLPFVDWPHMRRRTRELLDELHIDISPDVRVKDLSVAQRHIVGVAKALSHDAKIVIMDEPTAALSQREIEYLFDIIGDLKAAGKGVLFISHKFDEVFVIADRYTVLRDGLHVGTGTIADVTQPELVSMMVGRTLDEVFPKIDVPLGDTVLDVEHLTHETEFDDISFTLRRGEILGFYGLVGAGRSELMQAIFGISRPMSGAIRIGDRDVRIGSPADAISAGIAYVPEDRQVQGAILPMSIRENVTLPLVDRLSRGPFLDSGRERKLTRDLGHRLSLRAAHLEQRVEELSGGNQQKVVISKWLATRPAIIILDEPTKGIDIGSKAAVHEFMGELVQDGLAVILVSSELEEVLGMSDSIIVMYEGRIRRRFARAEATAEAVVTAATGAD
ncbi:MAG: sugar ABC transporter ATP-binding protein [Alphaproteobacteria bacterium]